MRILLELMFFGTELQAIVIQAQLSESDYFVAICAREVQKALQISIRGIGFF